MYTKKKRCFLPALAAFFVGMLLAFAPYTVQADKWADLDRVENTSDGLLVEWTGADGAAGHFLSRSWTKDGAFHEDEVYAVFDASVTSWTDTNVSPGIEYCYHVGICDESGPVENSGSVGITKMRLTAPTPAKASVSGNFITVSWKKSVGAEYYKIEFSERETFSKPISYRAAGTATSAKLTGLNPGRKYFVRVRAYYTPERATPAWEEDEYYHSVWSNTAKFTIPKKSPAKNARTLKYSGNKTVLQKMWTAGPSDACIEFLNLVKANKNGSSMSFASRADYQEATDYYIMLTGDWKVLSRNKSDLKRLSVTINTNSDNKAYASGKKGCLKYYKKAYNMLAKAGVKSGMSKYKAALKIEAYIRRIAKYGGKTPKHHTFYSILDSKKGVCQAYSQLFQVMCIQAGIDCRYCAGSYKGELHAWNKFKANGRWYYIDVTFRDTASPKSWPVSKKKLKNHKITSTLKFIDACGQYNHGI